ncbi:Lrp/AsnC ligand binding domain-containing protein [Chryseobacterium sp.]|uniref:Lrp/AsnC ligand binding domain-containing protein n=1 Tax=Chryseobacterium sp. TaxID=1871047 RepID=UPI001B06767D|nr:Lrp/AsnC ligand binding domain-containing protein [Chryseobacterium sp.]MBO9692922.1 Lrp/AsnC ligand binding domain-containing protein [Chryseobacterium sp.]
MNKNRISLSDFQNVDYEIDYIDRMIISLLTDNVKTPISLISRQVGVSTTTVFQRIKKLESASVIENSASFFYPERIGYKVIAYVGVCLGQPKYYPDAIEFVKSINEVVEAHYITGKYTILIKVLCKDNDHLMKIIKYLRKNDWIQSTETLLSLEQLINRQLKL